MGTTRAILLLLALLLAPPVRAGEPRIGIFDMKIVGFDDTLSVPGIDAVATALSRLGYTDVMTARELNALIDAQRRADVLGCQDISCLAEIGAAAGVDRLILTSLSKVGAAIVVSQQIINTRAAKVENRVSLTWRGPLESFTDLMGVAAEMLMAPYGKASLGTLVLTNAGILGASWRVGDTVISGSSTQVPSGIHTVVIEALGYEPKQQEVLVRAGQTTVVDGGLTPRPVNNRRGVGVAVGAFMPVGDDYASKKTGISLIGTSWLEFDALVVHPRAGFWFDFEETGKANYVNLVLDVGASWLMLRTDITPMLGGGMGAHWIKTDDPDRDPVTTSQWGMGGYVRIGALFFRQSSGRLAVTLDYNLISVSDGVLPQGLNASFMVTF